MKTKKNLITDALFVIKYKNGHTGIVIVQDQQHFAVMLDKKNNSLFAFSVKDVEDGKKILWLNMDRL